MGLIDLHCDTAWKIFHSNKEGNLLENSYHVDIKKLQRANSIAQFFALFIDQEEYLKRRVTPFEHCNDMFDCFYKELIRNKEYINLARNYDELVKNKEEGKISAFLTIEGAEPIENKISNINYFYRLGVRLITLTWNYENQIGYPNCNDKYRNKGLTSFGKEAVEEMNNLKILVDVSHLSDGGFYDVAELAKMPFVASHSNSREVTNHPRNLTDEMIKILANKGGIMGLNFCTPFITSTERITKVEHIVAHAKHIKNVGGIDVVSIGADFDGIGGSLEINNIGEMDKLALGLNKAGFSDDEIDKIFYKNAERVIKEL